MRYAVNASTGAEAAASIDLWRWARRTNQMRAARLLRSCLRFFLRRVLFLETAHLKVSFLVCQGIRGMICLPTIFG